MSYDDREAVIDMDQDHSAGGDIPDQDMDVAFSTMPPGDEGFDLSHAGGEHEVFDGFAEELAVRSGM
jgi:hypothetical protein